MSKKTIAGVIIGLIAIVVLFRFEFNGKQSLAAILFGSGSSQEQASKAFRKSGEIKMSELASLSGCELPPDSDTSANKYDSFAKCLTDKGVKMYGAYWCSHCQNQKKAFGDSFKYINYIECADPNIKGQLEVCQKEKIEGYPTWEFPQKAQ